MRRDAQGSAPAASCLCLAPKGMAPSSFSPPLGLNQTSVSVPITHNIDFFIPLFNSSLGPWHPGLAQSRHPIYLMNVASIHLVTYTRLLGAHSAGSVPAPHQV